MSLLSDECNRGVFWSGLLLSDVVAPQWRICWILAYQWMAIGRHGFYRCWFPWMQYPVHWQRGSWWWQMGMSTLWRIPFVLSLDKIWPHYLHMTLSSHQILDHRMMLHILIPCSKLRRFCYHRDWSPENCHYCMQQINTYRDRWIEVLLYWTHNSIVVCWWSDFHTDLSWVSDSKNLRWGDDQILHI